MTEDSPRIDIIVLNWNGREDTIDCLASLTQMNYPNFVIRAVDNGSVDDSVGAIRQRFPGVAIIENKANLGFAEGNNRGIAESLKSDASFVLLLNNDTTVDPNMLAALVEAARQFPRAGVFGPKIYYHADPSRLWYAGGYWDPRTLSFNEYGTGEVDRGQFDSIQETEWVIGCAMFVRAEVFSSVGLLEPSYFLNNEEIDFCSRARRAGFSCVYVPEARLWHKISVSFGGEDSPLKEYFNARNRLLWASRNAPAGLRARIYANSTMTLLRRFTRAMRLSTGPRPLTPRLWWWNVRSALRDPRNRAAAIGFRDFWLGRFGDCPDAVRRLAREWAARRSERATALRSAEPSQ